MERATRRHRPQVNAAQINDICAALCVTPGTRVAVVVDRAEEHFPAEPLWVGWFVELFHVPADALPSRLLEPSFAPIVTHPWITFIPNTEGIEEKRVVVYWRAWSPQERGFLAWCWDPRQKPGQRDQWQLYGFQPSRLTGWRDQLNLLGERPPRGRQTGSTTYNEQEWREIAPLKWEKVRDYAEAMGRPPTKADLAAEMGVNKSTITRYHKKWPIPLPKFTDG